MFSRLVACELNGQASGVMVSSIMSRGRRNKPPEYDRKSFLFYLHPGPLNCTFRRANVEPCVCVFAWQQVNSNVAPRLGVTAATWATAGPGYTTPLIENYFGLTNSEVSRSHAVTHRVDTMSHY